MVQINKRTNTTGSKQVLSSFMSAFVQSCLTNGSRFLFVFMHLLLPQYVWCLFVYECASVK